LIFAILGLPLVHTVGGLYGLLVALVLVSCLSDFSKTIYQKEMKFLHFSLVEGARSFFFATGVLLLLHFAGYGLKAWQIILLQSATMLPSTLAVYYSRVKVCDVFHLGAAWQLASSVIRGDYRFLFGYFTILALYSQTDVFLMKILASDVELAAYGSALRYYMLLLLALGATHAVLLPSIKTAKDIWELHGIIRQYRKMLFFFVPIVILGAWASGWIIPWIDQGKCPGAVLIFRILAVSSIISFAFSPYVSIVIRHEEFRFLFLLILSTLAFSLALNGFLIPRFGGVGAALTNFFSYGFLNGLIYRRASRRLDGGVPRT
jgi:O-antigen/teichoic acid export membrane protein